jgi:hypothetical protein
VTNTDSAIKSARQLLAKHGVEARSTNTGRYNVYIDGDRVFDRHHAIGGCYLDGGKTRYDWTAWITKQDDGQWMIHFAPADRFVATDERLADTLANALVEAIDHDRLTQVRADDEALNAQGTWLPGWGY